MFFDLIAQEFMGGFRRITQEKVAAISAQIEELTAYRDHLRMVLAEWDDRLRKTGKHQRAYLFQSLAGPPVRPRVRFGWSKRGK